jgi:steroid delta-isomerase-like uncharacterized protein
MRIFVRLAGPIAVLIAVGISGKLFAQSTTTESDQNREVVTNFHELMNRGEWGKAAELFAPDVRHHISWRGEGKDEIIVSGRATLAGNLEDIFRTFPDWKMEIVDMVVEGDAVVVRCRVSGTHRGTGTKRVNGGFLAGAQPTGKRFQVQHMHWYRVRDGKITAHFAARDDLGMTQQLGLLPFPPGITQ